MELELGQFEGQTLNSSSKDIHQFSTNTQHQSGLVISKENQLRKAVMRNHWEKSLATFDGQIINDVGILFKKHTMNFRRIL